MQKIKEILNLKKKFSKLLEKTTYSVLIWLIASLSERNLTARREWHEIFTVTKAKHSTKKTVPSKAIF